MQFADYDLACRSVTLTLDKTEAKELKTIFTGANSLCESDPLSFPSNHRKTIPTLAKLTNVISDMPSNNGLTEITIPFTILLDLSSCLFITKMLKPETIKTATGATPARLATLSECLLSGYEAQRGMNRAHPRLGYKAPIL